ncbi:MAG: sulfotransferase [Nitrospinae bacterium]|nr:sulfotransferase [Nitrospinota bacterium]
MYVTPKRIFVGGTGRSGTSIMNYLIGTHPEVYAIPTETRFIIDSHGLKDLVDALTVSYSFTRARDVAREFDHFLRRQLTDSFSERWGAHCVEQYVDLPVYLRELDEFVSKFRGAQFVRSIPPLGVNFYHPSQKSSILWTLPAYFPDRGELTAHAARFVDNVFMAATKKAGKKTWCEKTPHNILDIDFLYELFPDCAFIHIKRDPRGVAYSLMRMPWAPDKVEDVCEYILKPVYRRWFHLRSKVDLKSNYYMEIKLEEIASGREAWDEWFGVIAEAIGVDKSGYPYPSGGGVNLSIDQVNNWENSLEPKARSYMEKELGEYITAMGYS